MKAAIGPRPMADDHVQYLLRLCELELIERERRMIERRIKAAKFPATKSPPLADAAHRLPGKGTASTSRPSRR